MSAVYVRSLANECWGGDAIEREIESLFVEMVPSLRGRLVLVKPNLVVSSPGDAGVVTHPEVIRAVVRAARRRGARVMVGDNPGGVDGNSLRVARACGAFDASEGAFVNFGKEVVERQVQSRYTASLMMPRALFEADYVINLPIFKTHLLTTLTGAIKNCFGYIAGGCKSRLHLLAPSRRRFSELLVDVYSQRPPDLHILDALTVMDGDGPTHGRVRPFGKLLASTDGVALDAVMARLAGLEPQEVRSIAAAAARGLGSFEYVEAEHPLEAINDFVLPSTFAASPEEQRSLLSELSRLKPVLMPESCLECGDCAASCPAQAIVMGPRPVVGDDCIACFCCAELCPAGAMQAPSGRIREAFDRMF